MVVKMAAAMALVKELLMVEKGMFVCVGKKLKIVVVTALSKELLMVEMEKFASVGKTVKTMVAMVPTKELLMVARVKLALVGKADKMVVAMVLVKELSMELSMAVTVKPALVGKADKTVVGVVNGQAFVLMTDLWMPSDGWHSTQVLVVEVEVKLEDLGEEMDLLHCHFSQMLTSLQVLPPASPFHPSHCIHPLQLGAMRSPAPPKQIQYSLASAYPLALLVPYTFLQLGTKIGQEPCI